MNWTQTVLDLLAHGAGSAVALAADNRADLTYDDLRDLVGRAVIALNRFGIGRGDPVAIVLPTGPEMATTFLSVAAGATTAPLSPAYRGDEYRFYLTDLGARLLIVEERTATQARSVAAELGIPVAELSIDRDAPAGVFHLRGPEARTTPNGGPAGPDDVALVLHTSGTTSRPKIVPLSHRNVCASAAQIAACLALSPADRCLNIMPLFHIHGLTAALLATLSTGGSIFCTPGFNALRFFHWLEIARPTWYTASPTMHHAILERASRNPGILESVRLRFIRSSSAPLPPQVMQALEDTFDAPVIEAYGMTEAGHQMASNPLPPLARKAGSVGLASGPEIAIMNGAGERLRPGETGEVVIRGPNVTAGYRNAPEANATAFAGGWFRTGDQGYLDEDGYLWLTGRLKEIINRGGEKVSPREIDEALLDHPDVAQAVTFAIPHERLGEEIGAAIVLGPGADVSERAIRQFLAARLADFKVPRKVVFVPEIPKGPTGKPQRLGLAGRLGLA